MPNIKSAKKRMRTNEKSRLANLGVRTRVRSARRELLESIAAGDTEKSSAVYRSYCSVLDKAVKVGVVNKRTAMRRKGRAADRVRQLQSA